jgi:DNA-binding MarR family transcriptional regulator
MLPGMTTTSPLLTSVLDLALARTVVVRDVDASIGSHHGLGVNDLALLLELADAPERRLRRVDLARRLGITTSGLARQLGPLEKIGVVDRESSPGDARLALVVLTPAGAELAQNAARTASEAAKRVLGNVWSAAEQRQLAALLAKARSRA